jgi:hypothetical protein
MPTFPAAAESIAFGKSWFRAKSQLTETWDEPKARAAHNQRQPYVAVVSDVKGVRYFVEAHNDYIGVGLFDHAMREYLSYQFQELEPWRLFLTMATHRTFGGETEAVTAGTTYFFKPNGAITIDTEDFGSGQRSIKETQADVSGNWEMYPTFGNYQSLARAGR